jgi:hypothetical protein
MALCERRFYYPTPCGLFKLRKSDGDLAWECRPVSYIETTPCFWNMDVQRLPNGKLLVSGIRNSANAHGILVEEDGDGNLSSVSEIEPSPLGFDAETGSSEIWGVRCSVTEDYFYLMTHEFQFGTFIGPRYANITKYDHDGAVLDHKQFNSTISLTSFFAPSGDDVDVMRQLNNSQRIERYSPVSGAMIDNSSAVGWSNDHRGLFVNDGSHYYMGTILPSPGINKISMTDLSTTLVSPGATTAGTFQGPAAVRDGILAYTQIGFAVGSWRVVAVDTATLTELFDVFDFGRSLTANPCSSYVMATAIAVGGGATPATATKYEVRQIALDGTTNWSREFASSQWRSSDWMSYVRTLISEDESVVYVYGSLAHGSVFPGELEMSLYALDASNGDILWCFSAGPDVDLDGTNRQAGMSLLEEDDYLYLSTLRSRAPSQR